MRDALPTKIGKNESGIVNLDDQSGAGTHWTAYIKRGREVVYFDSIGHLKLYIVPGISQVIQLRLALNCKLPVLLLWDFKLIDLKTQNSSVFDNCKLKQIHAYLNTEKFLYDNLKTHYDGNIPI